MEWPSLIRRPMRHDEAARVGAALGTTEGRAYLYVAWLFEWEFSDGRGDSELAQACEVILADLNQRADLELRAA